MTGKVDEVAAEFNSEFWPRQFDPVRFKLKFN